jgi:hypothetical protein
LFLYSEIKLCVILKDKYDFTRSDTLLDDEFCSDGPKGLIKKIVRFSPRNINGKTYFNLGFGDLNILTNKIDDLSRPDNYDRDKILATIAATVLVFTDHFPDAIVYAQGSTSSRTRLYQMALNSNFLILSPSCISMATDMSIGICFSETLIIRHSWQCANKFTS